MTHFEDNPPCVPSRPLVDIIDRMNALVASERARKWREAREADARALRLATRYHVDFGYQACQTQHFREFAPALAFYIDHFEPNLSAEYRPRLLGYAFDDTSDGLSDTERAAVELAQEVS